MRQLLSGFNLLRPISLIHESKRQVYPPNCSRTWRLLILVVLTGLFMPFLAHNVSAANPSFTPDLTTSSSQTAVVNLKVTGPTGLAVARANVTIQPLNISGQTDANGYLQLRDLAFNGSFLKVDVEVKAQDLRNWRLQGAYLVVGQTIEVSARLSELKAGEPEEVIIATTPRWALNQPMPQVDPPVASAPGQRPQPGQNSLTVPATVRVCRMSLGGQVDTVSFKDYVKHVLPHEWLASWNAEALKAGAVAAKSYAWYWINRGGKWPTCDVHDNTDDQVYNPNTAATSTDKAVDDSWNVVITRNGELFQPHYCSGVPGDGSRTDTICRNTPGNWMSQWGSQYWAQQGKTFSWVLTYYYDNIELKGSNSAPLTKLSYSGGRPGKQGWLVSSVVVTLNATDSDNDLDYTEYSFDNANWLHYRTALSLPEGITTIYYRSKDKAGNLENTQQQSFKVDTRKPDWSVKVINENGGKTLYYDLLDPRPGSGSTGLHMKALTSAGDESKVFAEGCGFSPFKGTPYRLEFWSEDIAGNKTALRSMFFISSPFDAVAGDNPGSLRYALNNLNSGDTIIFNLPSVGVGSFRINLVAPLPRINRDNVTFDATGQEPSISSKGDGSQPGNLPTALQPQSQDSNKQNCPTELRVIVDGQNHIATGFEITGKNVSFLGFNLQGFREQAIWLNQTSESYLACNFIGTDEKGERATYGSESADEFAPIGIRVTGGGNHTIGGGEGAGNLLAGDLYILLRLEHTINNQILGNTFGTNREGKKLLGDPIEGVRKNGIVLDKETDNTRLESNLIAGQGTAAVRINGANNTRLVNNLIGIDRGQNNGLGQIMVGDEAKIAFVVVENGAKATLIKDNVFSNYNHTLIMVAGKGTDNTEIQGNYLGLNRQGKVLSKPLEELGTVGIWLKEGPANTRISDNTILELYTGIQLSGQATTKSTIINNRLGITVDNLIRRGNTYGIWIFEQASNNLIKGNTIVGGEEAVKIGTEPQDAAQSNTVSQNVIDGNRKGGIVLANDNYGEGTLNGQAGMANRNAARPNAELISANLSGGNLVISGTATAANFNSMVEVFLSAVNEEFPQGKTYLGTVKANADGSFQLTLSAGTVTAGTKLVVTSTLTTGDTSAFSGAIAVKS